MNQSEKGSKNLNILFLASTFPWPLESGLSHRVYASAIYLARRCRVTLYGLSKYSKGVSSPLESMSSSFQRIRVLPITREEKIRRAIFSPFSRLPWRVSGFQSRRLKKALSTDLADTRWDIVYAVDSNMAPYALSIPSRLTAIDFTDAYSRYWKSILAFSPLILRPLIYIEYLRMLSFEREIYRRADRCFIASPVDRDFISGDGDRKKWTILPNTVDTNHFTFQPPPHNHHLIFVGRMSYLPNKQAALRLCREIMPGIIRRIPDAVLFLVGSNPPPEILALDNGSSIRVTGAVDKILPYLRDSEVLLCPLSLGTGTRLKVLEAMAAGIPVISSNTGCEGIPVSTGKDIILAETNDQFIRETSNLLKSPGLGNQISLKARRLVEDKYSQDEIGRCLTEGLSLTAGPD